MHIHLSSITKQHSCIKILKLINVTNYDVKLWVFFLLLDFESQTALRDPIENNAPGGAKGRIYPSIHKK